jgi:hypothetical protein
MKNSINSLLARFGIAPAFQVANFRKAEKNFADLISLEQQAVSFVQSGLKLVNHAIKCELKRNGFKPEDILSGRVKMQSFATESKRDPRFKSQVYSVNGWVILKVKWKPNGFTLETKTAGEIKSHSDYLKQYGERNFDQKAAEAKEADAVNLEAVTNEKLLQEKSLKLVK